MSLLQYHHAKQMGQHTKLHAYEQLLHKIFISNVNMTSVLIKMHLGKNSYMNIIMYFITTK